MPHFGSSSSLSDAVYMDEWIPIPMEKFVEINSDMKEPQDDDVWQHGPVTLPDPPSSPWAKLTPKGVTYVLRPFCNLACHFLIFYC
jgi:hypothetical protein